MIKVSYGKNSIHIQGRHSGVNYTRVDLNPTDGKKFDLKSFCVFVSLLIISAVVIISFNKVISENVYLGMLIVFFIIIIGVFQVEIFDFLKTSFQMDLKSESLTWSDDFGKKKKNLYFSEMEEIRIVRVPEFEHPGKTGERTYLYRVETADNRKDVHIIAIFSDILKAREVAEKISKLSGRPIQNFIEDTDSPINAD